MLNEKFSYNSKKSVEKTTAYCFTTSDSSLNSMVHSTSYFVDDTLTASAAYEYDGINRIFSKSYAIGSRAFTKEFSYDKTRVSEITHGDIGTDSYEYDSYGRITGYTHDSAKTTYTYDSFGQLIRENNPTLDKTVIYCYDNIGNIADVYTYAYTTSDVEDTTPSEVYEYDAVKKDRVTRFLNEALTYDALGNLTSYGKYRYSWINGKLRGISSGSSSQSSLYTNCLLTYNGLGQRTKKDYTYNTNPLNSNAYGYRNISTYTYDHSGRLIREYDEDAFSYAPNSPNIREFIFLYDGEEIIGLMHRCGNTALQPYYFRKNLQGDVTGIYDASGTKIGEYTYDAWGNCSVTYGIGKDVVKNNPIRYRSYYYDKETNLYYLNARYYDPALRRFLSLDSTEYLNPDTPNGLNLYAYCYNDPVNYADPSGHNPALLENILNGVGVVAETALFVAAIVASAGSVGALVGVGAAAIGLSSTAVSTVITAATVSTYVVAGGVGLFGASNAMEVLSGGINPIRDYVMGGNQVAYNIVNGSFDTLGTIATIAGMIGPKVLQNIAKYAGTPKVSNGKAVGYAKDFFDRNGNWSFRIDATTHGNPNSANWHHNPHYHVVTRGGDGTAVYYLWEILKELFK